VRGPGFGVADVRGGRRPLKGSCSRDALLAATTVLAVGIALPVAVRAQTVIPSGSSTYNLNPANNPFQVNSGTTISVAAGRGIYGSNVSGWTLTNNGTVSSGSNNGVLLNSTSTVTNNGSIGGGAVPALQLNGAGSTVNNAGTITSTVSAATDGTVYLPSGGTVTNQQGALITATQNPIELNGPGTVVNAGTLQGTNGAGIVSQSTLTATNLATGRIFNGIFDNFGVATVTNAGFIGGTVTMGAGGMVTNQAGGTINSTGQGVSVGAAGTVINQAGGTITATSQGVYVSGIATVTNAGSISSSAAAGVKITAGGIVTNQAGGVISGTDGVLTSTTTGTVVNAGSISGTTIGVYVHGGGTITNQAGGVISGPSSILISSGTGLNVVTNAGTLSGTVSFGSGGLMANQTGGVITTASGAGVFMSFGTLTNAGSIAGATYGVQINHAGTITNQAGGVISGATGIFTALAANIVTNAGTVSGTSIGVALTAGGSVTNQAGGVVSGPTGIEISGGAGTVTNGGTITGTGGTAIQFTGAGANLVTLQSGAVVTGNIVGSTAGGATNTLTLQGSGSLTSTISNFTSLSLQSGAAWSLSGATTFASATTIGAGSSLQIGNAANPGAVFTGDMAVANGGQLSGHGTIAGNVTSSGTVTPGGTIGTLTVTGNYVQSATGSLAIELAPSAASKLAVGGTATIAGTLALTADPGSYVNKTVYQILTAGGGVTGTFGQVTGAQVSPVLLVVPSYTANAVDLTVQLGSFSGLGTPNQNAVGQALNVIASSSPAAFAPLLGALEALPTTPQLLHGIDQIGGAGEGYADLASTAVRTGQLVTTALGEQLFLTHAATSGAAALAQGPGNQRVQLASLDPLATVAQAAPEAARSPWTVWTSGFGEFGSIAGDGNAHALNFATGGALFGADYRLDPQLLAGAFVGYAGAGTGLTGLAGTGTVNSYTFGLYASYQIDRFYLDATAGYAYDDEQLQRTIAFPGFASPSATGDTHANQFLASLETGRAYRLAPAIVATPFVGLQVATVDQAALTETGAGALDLTAKDETIASVRGIIGLRLDRDIAVRDLGFGGDQLVNAGIRLGWAHDYADTGRTVTASFAGAPGSSFTLESATPRRDSALIGAGVAAKIGDQASVYVRYDGDVNDRDYAHAVIGGVRFTW
jgi:uncharacterized protein with beta-barrel porin domain